MDDPYDRVTQILQSQAQPQSFSSYAPQAMPLPANIIDAFQYSANASGGNLANNVASYVNQQQDNERQNAMGILSVFEKQRAAGDAQTKALGDKIDMFTGGDPEGTAMFLQALHDDPEPIDPSNSYQVMTKLAAIKKQTGYESPELSLKRRKDELSVEKLEADINATRALANSRNIGGSGSRKLSATEQREMFEADDVLKAASNAKNALTSAVDILDNAEVKPYSGFGAEALTDAARIPIIGGMVADKERGAATTEYKNLVSEQALSNLKAIFGGNPTEGEREVLLKMQALPTYTIGEQKRIIQNAVEAADRRIGANQNKIKAIQTGDYSGFGNTDSSDNGFDDLPDPSAYSGKTVTDSDTGIKYRSNGAEWVKL